MPKIKTRKAVAKRFKITKTGKVMKTTGGQGHFNARETGNTKRNKRRSSEIAKADHKNIKIFMPHS